MLDALTIAVASLAVILMGSIPWQNNPHLEKGQDTFGRSLHHLVPNLFGRCINHGQCSLLEYFAMEQVLHHCKVKGIPETSENIVTIYNAMVEIVALYDCTTTW